MRKAMFSWRPRRSPTLPAQKQLRDAERLALRTARSPSPEMVTALGAAARVLRQWGRRDAAARIEHACVGRPASEVREDAAARELARMAGELQSLLDQIRASFDRDSADEEHFPSTIDPRIYHVRLILDYFGDLAGKRVLDVGCGKGRFARVLKERHPSAEVWGLDISAEMLRYVPPGIETRQGPMTDLPFADAWFDAAYATESLEHAVEVETAVNEICRVVRPDGRIVIIDKNVEQAGRLATPAWEKWFGRRELEALLAKHCKEVSSEFISYWADVPPDGLFLAWKAVR